MTARLAFLLGLSLAPLSAVAAQQAPILQPGDRVRVEGTNLRGHFDVVAWTDSDRRLREVRGRLEIPVALDSIRRLEVSRGRESRARSAFRRGGIGLLVGGGVGMFMGLLSGDDPADTFFALTAEGKAILLGGTLGTVGFTVGAFSGVVAPSRRWQRLIPPLSVSLVRPPGGGIGVDTSP